VGTAENAQVVPVDSQNFSQNQHVTSYAKRSPDNQPQTTLAMQALPVDGRGECAPAYHAAVHA